jgi:hypothetical protein
MQISKGRLHYTIALIFALIAGLTIMSMDGASAQRLVDPESESESVISPTFEQGRKTFNMFTTELPEVREGTLGITGDIYSLPMLVVNAGDNVTIHFFNTDVDTVDKHTFTIDSPYNINEEVMNGQQVAISFIANQQEYSSITALTFPRR